MKFADINKRFTEIVAEYIAKGYTINTGTMSGCQGLARVDLTDGKEIIRVLLDDDSYWDDIDEVRESGEWFAYNTIELTVGRNTDSVQINGTKNDIIWNHHLEIISKETFYRIGESRSQFYGSIEDSRNQQRKSRKRWKDSGRKAFGDKDEKVFPASANEIVLPFMRRQNGCKTIKLKDIEKVVRENQYGKATYWVYAKSKRYKIA